MSRRPSLIQTIDALPEHDAKRQLQRLHVCLVDLARNVSHQIKGVSDFGDLMTFRRQTREDCLQMGAILADIARMLG